LRRIVIDASLAAALLIPDEWTYAVPAIEDVIASAELHAPLHWPIELVSTLVNAEHRKRMSVAARTSAIIRAQRLLALIDVDDLLPSLAIADLAATTGLTAYDAAYLELALRRGADLASNDGDLIDAARSRGIPVVTTRTR